MMTTTPSLYSSFSSLIPSKTTGANLWWELSAFIKLSGAAHGLQISGSGTLHVRRTLNSSILERWVGKKGKRRFRSETHHHFVFANQQSTASQSELAKVNLPRPSYLMFQARVFKHQGKRLDMLSSQLIATPQVDGVFYSLVNFLRPRLDMQSLCKMVWKQIYWISC